MHYTAFDFTQLDGYCRLTIELPNAVRVEFFSTEAELLVPARQLVLKPWGAERLKPIGG